MPALDFTEIVPATSGAGRDTFELFARDVLHLIGFKVLEGPDRGADGGRDLIVEERRAGVGGETVVRWLVSCKHKAHSGASVTPADEPDVNDRLKAHSCDAFLGFYSTVPSSGLAAKLSGAAAAFSYAIFDAERIERELLGSQDGVRLAKRYFPKSVTAWQLTRRDAAKIFADPIELKCDSCGNSLLTPEPHGIICLWHPYNETVDRNRTEQVYFCCKGACDKRLRVAFRNRKLIDTWEDISDLVIPTVYIRWVIGTINELQEGHKYSESALSKVKDMLLNLFPLVCRHPSEEDKDRVRSLQSIPGYLGGLGT